jgi:hypothetical protein
MRKNLCLLLWCFLAWSCSKEYQEHTSSLVNALQQHLSKADFNSLDRQSIRVYTYRDQRIFRARIQQRELVVLLTAQNKVREGRIIDFNFKDPSTATGRVTIQDIDGSPIQSHDIVLGRVVPSLVQPLTKEYNAVQTNTKTICTDCTLPEVIVATVHRKGESSSAFFYSMSWLFGTSWGYTTYLPIYVDGGGGGSPIEVDPPIGNPDPIDPKKYTDCFEQVNDQLATYSMTIYSDIPADQDAGVVFDLKAHYAGHTFIELNKSNPYNSVRQVFGFYPGSMWGALSGNNTASKIVDDSEHEYQASYTISLSRPQFVAAVQRIQQLYGHSYHISNFNCTDFAMSVFHAAGGQMLLNPQYNIPVYGNSSGNNTPNGVYEQIAAMQAAGVTGATANGNKNYGPHGKGPCH